MTRAISSEMLHVSTVAIDGRAVLLEGPSGAGKSDLALRLIDRGAELVSDDYTLLTRHGDALVATAPDTIAGQIEVRGVGIIRMRAAASAPAALLVRLGVPERLPEAQVRRIAGVALPEVVLAPFEPSAPIKVELALRQLQERAA